MDDSIFRGVLIDQSVPNPSEILKLTKIVGTVQTTLEGESFRGNVLFHNIEVSTEALWPVLQQVAERIKSHGWFFNLINGNTMYFVMPRAILLAHNDEHELKDIFDYATAHGIHPEQLEFKKMFDNPFV